MSELKNSSDVLGLILWGLAFPNEEVIFRTGTAVWEGADCHAFLRFNGISLSLAETPFNVAAPFEEFPFLAFRPIREDTDAHSSLVGFPHFELIAHLLAVEGGRIGHTDKWIFLSIINKGSRRGFAAKEIAACYNKSAENENNDHDEQPVWESHSTSWSEKYA